MTARIRPDDDRGAIAVLAALLSVVLFAVGALAVDLGDLYDTKLRVQQTADRAAVSAAQELPVYVKTRDAAIDYVDKNPVFRDHFGADTCPACWTDGDAANGEVTVLDSNDQPTTADDGRTVRVALPPHGVGPTLAGSMGFGQTAVARSATAAIRSPFEGVAPLAVPAGAAGRYCLQDSDDFSSDVVRAALLATNAPSPTPSPSLSPTPSPSPVSPAPLAAPPTVTGVSPDHGGAGTTVTVEGTGFTGVLTVSFGANLAVTVTVLSATRLLAVAPAGSGRVDIVVTANGLASAVNSDDRFTYDPCAGTDGSLGYLDIPRAAPTSDTFVANLTHDSDHGLAPFPTGLLPTPDTRCTTSSGTISGAILDTQGGSLGEGANCAHFTAEKVADAATALLDGIDGAPGRLQNPPSGHASGTVAGRAGIDTDGLGAFLNEPLATFLAQLSGPAVPGQVKDTILDCPRFLVIPVLDVTSVKRKGFYPVVGFAGAFVANLDTDSEGRIVDMQAYVFSLDWLPPSTRRGGTMPYLGVGPKKAVLVPDPSS